MADYMDFGTGIALIKGLSKSFITAEAEAAQTAAEAAEAAEAAAASVQFPVSYAAQQLTEAQKAQARQNIGAVVATPSETLNYLTGE